MALTILLLSGICLGFAFIVEKKITEGKYHPETCVFLVAGISSLVAAPLLLYKFMIPTDLTYWLLALASVGTYGLGNLFAFKAYKLMDASAVGLINRLNIVITALIGLIFLKETYTSLSYVGFILILFGGLFIVYEKGKMRWNRGTIFSLIMAAGYAMAAVFDKLVLREFSPFTYVVLNNFLVAVLFSTFREARLEAGELFRKRPGLVILSGLLVPGSWIGFLYVLQAGAVSKVSPIYDSVALACTVIIGIIFLKETQRISQKVIGTVAIIAGVFLLG